MDISTEKKICRAIQTHHTIKFKHEGELTFMHIKPYALFLSAKNRKILLGVEYDSIGGGNKFYPKSFDTDDISNLLIMPDVFVPNKSFNIENIGNLKKNICSINHSGD